MMVHDLNRVLEHLRRLSADREEMQTDLGLLQRFVARRDEVSFAQLVARHGPMVLATCQRVLNHDQDAVDAFQATFLVLARKAASVQWHESICGWLFTIARQIAIKARATNERRRLREAEHIPMPSVELPGPDAQSLRLALDEEIARLSKRQRMAILLCYAEGRSQKEAARQLGWTPGQVRGCLDRARTLLRRRLGKRGLAVSCGMLGMTLSAAAFASAARTLTGVTARAATIFMVGGSTAGLVSSRVLSLTMGGLRMLSVTKIKVVGFVLLAMVLTYGAIWSGLGAQQPAAAQRAEKPVAQGLPGTGTAGDTKTPEHGSVGQFPPGPSEATAQAGVPRPKTEERPNDGSSARGAPALAALSPDGGFVAVLRNSEVRVLHTDNGGIVWRLAQVQSGKQYVIDAATGKLMAMNEAALERSVEFSTDGKILRVFSERHPTSAPPRPTGQENTSIDGSALSGLLKINDPEIQVLTAKLLKALATRHEKTMLGLPQPGTAPQPIPNAASPAEINAGTDALKKQIDRLSRELEDLKVKLERPAAKGF